MIIWINIDFHSCVTDWCLQYGTNQQYTKCKRASKDGEACYHPIIKYGSTIGGVPFEAYNYNSYFIKWCRQLFPTKNFINSSIRAGFNQHTSNFFGAVYWCSSYDENGPHWCDWKDGYWKDSTLDWNTVPKELPKTWKRWSDNFLVEAFSCNTKWGISALNNYG